MYFFKFLVNIFYFTVIYFAFSNDKLAIFLFRVENIAQLKCGIEKFKFINMIIFNKNIHLPYNKKMVNTCL